MNVFSANGLIYRSVRTRFEPVSSGHTLHTTNHAVSNVVKVSAKEKTSDISELN
jgi:hypothetical protein